MSIKNKLSFYNYHRIPSTFVLFFVSSLVFLLAILFLFGIQKAHATGGLYIYNASGTVAFDITSSGILEYGATTSGQITSTVASGTAPLVIASPTLNTNLNADLLDGYHAADLVTSPVGAITLWGSATAPDGWLLCDGSSLLRAGTYAGLFAVIGTTFGTADGTHFNLPDMRGVFPKGAGTTNRTLGKDANGNYYAGTLGTYLTDMLQGHGHYVEDDSGAHRNIGYPGGYGDSGQLVGTGGRANTLVAKPFFDTGYGTPRIGYTTEPQSLGLYYIIKYSGAGLPISGLVVASPVSGSGTTASPLTADLTRIKPVSDSTTAVQINKADGTTNVLNVDTTNGRVGIGTTSPVAKLDVTSGDIQLTTAQRKILFDSPLRYIQGTRSGADYLTFSQNAYAPGIQLGFDAGAGFGPTMTLAPVSTTNNPGNVGIGVTSPAVKLDVNGVISVRDGGTKGVYGGMVSEVGGLLLDVGINEDSGARFGGYTQANSGGLIRFSSWSGVPNPITLLVRAAGGTAATTAMYIDGAGYVHFPTGHGDLAENYQISGTALRGNLISIDNTTAKTAITSSPTQPNLLGVVSTKPGAVMDVDGGFQVGYDTKPTYNNEKVPVALTGAVPTLVTSQNGTINIGDAIGLSNNPGFGAKMITAGNIVGKALETLDASSTCQSASSTESITWPEDDGKNTLKPCFSLPDGTIVGKIMVAVNVSWYDPGTNVSDLIEIVKKQQAEIEQMKTQLTSLENKNK